MTYFADATAVVGNFSSVLNIILLITAVSLGALNIRNKYEKGKDAETLKTLKESNDAFATRREADKIVLDARDAEILVLHQKAEVLEKHVTQAPDITKLIVQLSKQHKEAMTEIGKVAVELGNVAKAISKENR